MNIYYDVEDNHYRTYPDGDIATIDQMRELIENKNLSIAKIQQENQKQKEVIDKILNETKETRNILNNNRDDNMLSKSCLLSYLEIVEDLLKEVSE